MHRSGTSILSNAMKIYGAKHGKYLLKANEYNQTGYWEDEEIVKLNDDALKIANLHWYSILPLTQMNIDKLNEHHFINKIHLILNNYAENNISVIKDPRITKLIPLWHKAIEDFKIFKIYYIFAIRSPLEVAYSLQKRDSFPLNYSQYLWFSYNFNCLSYLYQNNIPWLTIDYQDFINNTEYNLDNISKFINITYDTLEKNIFINNIITKKLCHYTSKNTDDSIFLELYNNIKSNRLKNIISDIQIDYTELYSAYEEMINNINEKNKYLIKQIIDRNNELSNLYSSKFYKIYNNLRYVYGFISGHRST